MKILALALVLSLHAVAQQPPDSQRVTAEQQQTAKPQQGNADTMAISVKLLNSGKSAAEARQDSQTVADAKQASVRLFWLTVVTIVVAGLQTIVLIKTMGVMQNTARTQQRAYVSVRPGSISHLPFPDAPARVSIRLENVGQTPAHEIRISFGWSVAKFPHPADYKFPVEHSQAGTGNTVLDPGQEQFANLLGGIDLDEIKAAAIQSGRIAEPNYKGEVRLCVTGTVSYRDVFKTLYTRRYCFFFGGDTGTEGRYCDIHNTAT